MLHVYSYTPTMRSGRLLASLKVASMSSSRTIALTPAFQTLFSSGCAIPRSSVNANAQRSFVTMNGDGDHSDNLDLIFEQKHSLRSKIRRALKSMDPIQRSHEDNMIQDIVLQAPWFRSSDSVCAYITCDALREVSTSRILSAFLTDPSNDYKRLYVPRVEDKNSNMRMLKITNVNDLVASSMNILEPEPVDHNGNLREDVMQATEPVDLFILPGLAFDRSGRRLGRSGGKWQIINSRKDFFFMQQKTSYSSPSAELVSHLRYKNS